MPLDLLQELHKNPFLLAPMAGITDCAFRHFMKKQGAGILTTELVSANGIEHGSLRTRKIMQIEPSQVPVGIQIFGECPENLAKATAFCEEKGADFVDLNLGCPVNKVVKKGAGSAMLKDLPKLGHTLSLMKKATSLPVTIKIRTGWDQNSRNALEVAHVAFNEGVTWVAIHGRTRAQGYEGLADWDFIKAVKEAAPLPIIGNGDITSASKALARLKTSGCDGVMIGRGCLKNPQIFKESLNLMQAHTKITKKNLYDLFLELYKSLVLYCEPKILNLQIKKFASWFSTGYPHSAQFRKQLFTQKDPKDLLKIIEDYFEQIAALPQKDTSDEAFLMGGHG